MAYTTIDDPSAYFQTALYTGNGTSTNAITNDGNSDLQPDWLWLKSRSITSDNIIFDSTRGTNKRVSTNTTSAEETQAFYSSFDSDGFTLGDSNANVNQSSATYVNWQWKANGGTTSSNGNGSITSTVQADTTAGFSIVTYTGTGSTATIGHGLGAIPDMIIVKNRSASQNWRVFHKDAYHGGGYGQYQSGIKLNSSAAADHGANSYWNNTAFTSNVFTIHTNAEVNVNSQNFVAYCFKSIQGYSKFGRYKGQENADGPFVYTGFAPAWIMIKQTDQSRDWLILDNKREPNNDSSRLRLKANSSGADDDSADNGIDFLSNGFKIRTGANGLNANTGNFVYMTFAEHPFVSSKGVPATAR
tara:strand:+ start:1 stop:1077 length:1077 start_codon:yes stop_codon:yes gene_type:complete